MTQALARYLEELNEQRPQAVDLFGNCPHCGRSCDDLRGAPCPADDCPSNQEGPRA